jgi:type I pantothenate kinase
LSTLPASPSIGVELIAKRLTSMLTPGHVFIVGITGSVAAGKSTLSAALEACLGVAYRVETIGTDGYLFTNATLEAMGMTARKGFPETYDTSALLEMLSQARTGPVCVPGYSHKTYDIDPALSRTIDRPDILIVEGLGLSSRQRAPAAANAFDVFIYIDAAEEDLETWFVDRFLALCASAKTDPSSFYVRFLGMAPSEATAFAHMIWREINLPNLRDHISKARDDADIVVLKDRGHALHVIANNHRFAGLASEKATGCFG